ncbi:MAG: KpsF/GutQ family sugar-phosphate isomerase [Planctomycetales bacterium]|nr:KpsF/GutQ family sugar-phosphate isomerase [Planctomycetales bacterium]
MEAPLRAAARSPAVAKLNPFEQIRYAREVLRLEAAALETVAGRIDGSFCAAIDCILKCPTSVIVSGMGKAGLIGQKIAATLASTGTPSHFLHPSEALHGDLGRIRRDDVVLILSQSGETEEITRLLAPLSEVGADLLAITQSRHSTLGRAARVTLELGSLTEACSLGLAPSCSTTAMLGYGDALALVISRIRQFTAEDFAQFHPGGSLGRRLSRVEDVMRPLNQCRLARLPQPVRSVLVNQRTSGRRSGAVMVVDDGGRLTGIFTDSDLARLLEKRCDEALDGAIERVMTRDPLIARSGWLVRQAEDMMAQRKISELPVVDHDNRPLGLLDITDLLGRDHQPESAASELPRIHPFVPETA